MRGGKHTTCAARRKHMALQTFVVAVDELQQVCWRRHGQLRVVGSGTDERAAAGGDGSGSTARRVSDRRHLAPAALRARCMHAAAMPAAAPEHALASAHGAVQAVAVACVARLCQLRGQLLQVQLCGCQQLRAGAGTLLLQRASRCQAALKAWTARLQPRGAA